MQVKIYPYAENKQGDKASLFYENDKPLAFDALHSMFLFAIERNMTVKDLYSLSYDFVITDALER